MIKGESVLTAYDSISGVDWLPMYEGVEAWDLELLEKRMKADIYRGEGHKCEYDKREKQLYEKLV